MPHGDLRRARPKRTPHQGLSSNHLPQYCFASPVLTPRIGRGTWCCRGSITARARTARGVNCSTSGITQPTATETARIPARCLGSPDSHHNHGRATCTGIDGRTRFLDIGAADARHHSSDIWSTDAPPALPRAGPAGHHILCSPLVGARGADCPVRGVTCDLARCRGTLVPVPAIHSGHRWLYRCT